MRTLNTSVVDIYICFDTHKSRPKSTVSSLSTTKEQVKIKLGNRILPQAETPIFLGATLDYGLAWKPQIESIRKRGIQKLALLKRLSGTHWGYHTAF